MSHHTELDKKQTAFLFQEESVDVHPTFILFLEKSC